MSDLPAVDRTDFRRILARNIALPLIASFINIALFVALMMSLLSVLKSLNHTEMVISEADKLNNAAMDMQAAVRGFLITGDDDFLEPFHLASPEFNKGIQKLQRLVEDNPTQVERLGRIDVMHGEWEIYAHEVIELRRKGQNYLPLVRNRGRAEFEEFRQEFAAFRDAEAQALRSHNDSVQFTGVTAIVIYLAASFLVTVLLGILGRRELLQLSSTYSTSLAEREEHAKLLERQAWHRSGQAQLAERSVGKNALPDLGRTMLDFLAHYLNAAVAALYVRERENGALQRVATYGVSPQADVLPQSFGAGESLVEQALFSKRVIRLDDVPDDYLKINTGLGSATPRHVLLVPIINENSSNGVIELGFLHAPEPHALDFLQLVSPNIGGTIEASLYRRRLQEALHETQQLNEELQVQQEELRTANEELEEQSRVLEESQALLENQKAELEQTNEKLLEQASVLDEKNSDLNRARAELEERAQELQRASKYKSEFLANMSHELRTPLNSSMILAKILAENAKANLDEEQVQFARSIYSAGNDLLNLINDILDISKVEAGKLELRPEQVEVRQLVEDLRMTFAPLAAQKKLDLHIQVSDKTPQYVVTDRQRVEQILKNLLSNAVKFTDQGKIGLAVTATAEGECAFAVSDTGIGISEDQQNIIFEAFQQADGSINRRFGGTGLGLSISRDLAVLLGGSIHVKSHLGAGSTFTLLLPWELQLSDEPLPVHAPSQPPKVAPAPAHKPETTAPLALPVFADDRDKLAAAVRSVLVIEDDVTFAKILYELAHELDYQCAVATTAAEGLRMASELTPNAILLDLGLPDSSGISVLQKLKSSPATRHIPVHIVSAEDRTEAALQLGAVGYVIKPATHDSLRQMFGKLEEKLTQKMKRVLLVEDDALQRESITHLIGEDDIEITAVPLGAEALELLRHEIFDCMIIDLKLPDMQGHELLRKMSSEKICSFPPVIVYTGRNLTREEEHELLKYSRSIIIKGARSPERLLDEVTLFLHKVEAELSSDRQKMLRTVRSRDSAIEGRKILLVDDDVRNVFALTGALEQKGAVVEIARNGIEAIEKVQKVSDIDLVLMDIMMPGMDGLEATRRIRADNRFQRLPIIAITAKAMKDDQEQCLKAGASDYLAKPIDIDRLYSMLRVWMPNLDRV